METKYNSVFLGIIYTIFSKSFYQHALREWQGKFFKYLLLVITILSILTSARITINANNLLHAYLNEILPTLPTLELKQGKLSAKTDKPYFIYLPGTHFATAIIDTNNKYKNFEKDSSLLLMGPDKYYLKINYNDIRSFNYSQSEDVVIDAQMLQGNFTKYHFRVLSAVYFTALIISFIVLFILYNIFIGFLAIFTSTIAACFNVKFNYRFYLKLTTLSATIPSIFFMVLYLGGWLNVNTFLGYLILQIIYLFLSVYFIYDIKK